MEPVPTRIVLTPQLVLEPSLPHHAPELFEAIIRNKERLRQWLPWLTPEYSLSDLTGFLEEREKENYDRSGLTCMICHEGRICGAIGLHLIDRRNRATSMGYWIDSAHEGQGIVTRACSAVITRAFREYALHRVEIRCATGNERSCAVPRRLGFAEEGTLRDAQLIFDRWVDLRVFSMLEDDWAKLQGTSTGFKS
jgi:ribosomal-protein-serine acetyltransferase